MLIDRRLYQALHNDSQASTIYSETSEMQSTIIARWLGL
jgi:alkylation response protein AidB-like acyl-CoA dehydrogenase